jgi:hypothetical protein
MNNPIDRTGPAPDASRRAPSASDRPATSQPSLPFLDDNDSDDTTPAIGAYGPRRTPRRPSDAAYVLETRDGRVYFARPVPLVLGRPTLTVDDTTDEVKVAYQLTDEDGAHAMLACFDGFTLCNCQRFADDWDCPHVAALHGAGLAMGDAPYTPADAGIGGAR